MPLASLVGALRAELKQARGSADPELPLVVGPVTVEINVVARREASAKFGAKFFAFLDTGVEGKAGSERTHKLTLTLTPVIRRARMASCVWATRRPAAHRCPASTTELGRPA